MSEKKECTESQCKSCHEKCSSRKAPPKSQLMDGCSVKKVIGVVSGKGGVGKSTITAMLALEMNCRGHSVAVLDADITGPSMPRGLGLSGRRAQSAEDGLLPVVNDQGIKVMSVNLLMEDETMPVLWRGPVIGGVLQQFWTDVIWGNVDYMFVDMPPGTADVALTVFQSLPVDGLIIVSSPQDLVAMIVSKAVNMAKTMHVPVLGLVENMAYVECPDCGKKIEMFGASHVAETTAKFNLPLLGRLPLDARLADAFDRGQIVEMLDFLPKELADAVE